MAKTRRRKKRTHVIQEDDPSKKGQPKSFVLRRGRHAALLKDLEGDMRRLMSPNTAAKLKEHKRNVLRDFVHVAGPLGVTHLLLLTATQNAAYLRVAKSPRGPTITLRIHSYALMRDVLSSQQRPRAPQAMWTTPPLVVMNNFNAAPAGKDGENSASAEHLKLVTVMFQNLFPSINVGTVKLSSCQRVLLLDHDRDTGRVSLRHYAVSVQPTGVSKNLKSLLARKGLPDMGRMADVAEFLTRSGYGSESEGEEADASKVELAEGLGRGNVAARQSRVRLSEVGPRLELEVVKIEEGLCEGRVLYHRYQKRSPAEETAQQAEAEARRKLKEERRSQQDANVRRKASDKKRRAGDDAGGTDADGKRRKRKKEWWEEGGAPTAEPDDDAEWYRQEVGEAPDDTFRPAGGQGGRGGRGGDRGGRGGGGSSRGRGRGDGGGFSGARRGRGDRAGGRDLKGGRDKKEERGGQRKR